MLLRISTLLVLSVLASQWAQAQYQSSPTRGLKTTTFASPLTGFLEECVIPKPIPESRISQAPISKKLEDLCRLEFQNETAYHLAVCPKYKSTNPALEFYVIADGLSKADYEYKYCTSTGDRPGKKIAKFKQSVSCSYTPSILGYYQLSEFLGGGRVPPSVLRTVDFEYHKKMRQHALATIAKNPWMSSSLIGQTWIGEWARALANPASPAGQRVYTADAKGLYGALSVNPDNEEKYSEVYGGWRDYSLRFQSFKSTAAFRNLNDGRPLSARVGTQFAEAAQPVQQLKDLSDMLMMDYIMGQTDRPGNIHYIERWQILEPNGKVRSEKVRYIKRPGTDNRGRPTEFKVVDPKQAEELGVGEKAVVREMLLKDNDCGVIKGNETKRQGLLTSIAHLSPKTYSRVLWLAKQVSDSPALMKNYLKTEWLFTDQDYAVVTGDLMALAKMLSTKCLNGQLHLDLDIENHLRGYTEKSCAIVPENL